MNKPQPSNGSSAHWRNQLFVNLSSAPDLAVPKPLAVKPHQVSERTSASERKERLAKSRDLTPDPRACFSLVEDLQFLQWLVLTGRIFDANYFPRAMAEESFLDENNAAGNLAEYFSSSGENFTLT